MPVGDLCLAYGPLRGAGGRGRRAAGAAQQRAQPGEDLLDVEGLDHVVVGAGVQARDAVGGLHEGGEHEDGGPVALGAQHPADLEAVDARHHHVEDEHVRRVPVRLRQRLHTVRDRRHPVPLQRQRTLQGMTDGTVVFGEQHSLGHSLSVPSPPPPHPAPIPRQPPLFTPLSPSHQPRATRLTHECFRHPVASTEKHRRTADLAPRTPRPPEPPRPTSGPAAPGPAVTAAWRRGEEVCAEVALGDDTAQHADAFASRPPSRPSPTHPKRGTLNPPAPLAPKRHPQLRPSPLPPETAPLNPPVPLPTRGTPRPPELHPPRNLSPAHRPPPTQHQPPAHDPHPPEASAARRTEPPPTRSLSPTTDRTPTHPTPQPLGRPSRVGGWAGLSAATRPAARRTAPRSPRPPAEPTASARPAPPAARSIRSASPSAPQSSDAA